MGLVFLWCKPADQTFAWVNREKMYIWRSVYCGCSAPSPWARFGSWRCVTWTTGIRFGLEIWQLENGITASLLQNYQFHRKSRTLCARLDAQSQPSGKVGAALGPRTQPQCGGDQEWVVPGHWSTVPMYGAGRGQHQGPIPLSRAERGLRTQSSPLFIWPTGPKTWAPLVYVNVGHWGLLFVCLYISTWHSIDVHLDSCHVCVCVLGERG